MTAPSRHPAGRNAAKVVATWFGAGLLPVAPGTWGSLIALPLAWVIQWAGGPVSLALAALAVFLIGWWASESHAAATDRSDPSEVVVDEVVGQWITLLMAGQDWRLYVVGFVLFRIADVWKPWPVRWADRSLHGGLGIMLDDVLAGIYALIALALIAVLIGGSHVS